MEKLTQGQKKALQEYLQNSKEETFNSRNGGMDEGYLWNRHRFVTAATTGILPDGNEGKQMLHTITSLTTEQGDNSRLTNVATDVHLTVRADNSFNNNSLGNRTTDVKSEISITNNVELNGGGWVAFGALVVTSATALGFFFGPSACKLLSDLVQK